MRPNLRLHHAATWDREDATGPAVLGRQAHRFTAKEAPSHLLGFIELLQPLLLEEGGTLPADLTDVPPRIEMLLPAEAKVEARRPLLALYVLWNHVMAADLRRPDAEAVIARFERDLADPSIESFAVRLLLDGPIDWSPEELGALARGRLADLERGRGQELPARIDTALLLLAARALAEDNRPEEARTLLGHAVVSLPGNTDLIELERRWDDEPAPFDLRRFSLWLHTDDPPDEPPPDRADV